MVEPLSVTDEVIIPGECLAERFARSSGPGGQNVNKVETSVQLRFDLAGCSVLRSDQKRRLVRLAGSRINRDGQLLISADRSRSQAANREEARRRLAQLIRQAPPRPPRRVATRPTKGSVDRRLQRKQRRGQVKSLRKKPNRPGD